MSSAGDLNFVAIDLETANSDMASICQIGLVEFKNGIQVAEWKSYVDPEEDFDGINISIHGIDDRTVIGAPTYSALHKTLNNHLDNKTVVCHTHFDRVALHQAAKKNNVSAPNCRWLDSARVARRSWKQCAWKGYGLDSVCSMLGYQFKHHDALEDAKAAAHIILAACREANFDIEAWIKRVEQPIDLAHRESGSGSSFYIKRNGNPEGELYGDILVFTGALEISRQEAASLAASIGCQVTSSITKKTTILVVGDQEIKKLAGHEKSSKHRKAEELIAAGSPIRILRESDFKALVRMATIGPRHRQ